MNIKEALKKYHKIEIELLLAHVLRKPKEFLYLNIDRRLSPRQMTRISQIAKRRIKGEPVAYILGYKDFCGFRFKVNRDVLIPRPETEELVHKVYQVCKVYEGVKPLKILDIGTGSGCIAVSLAKQFSIFPTSPSLRRAGNYQFSITASDISKKALSVAKFNTKKYKVKIKFIQSDLFKNIRGKFDIIVANLPYVTEKNYESSIAKAKEDRLRIKNLEYEPKRALTDGTNGWKVYERFLREVPKILNTKYEILLEIDPKSKKHLSAWAGKYLPKAKTRFYRDFNNLWRYFQISF